MVGDFFTKPLQGKLFYKFRKLIMNLQDWHTRPIAGVCWRINYFFYLFIRSIYTMLPCISNRFVTHTLKIQFSSCNRKNQIHWHLNSRFFTKQFPSFLNDGLLLLNNLICQ
jgi:hypothetical protein